MNNRRSASRKMGITGSSSSSSSKTAGTEERGSHNQSRDKDRLSGLLESLPMNRSRSRGPRQLKPLGEDTYRSMMLKP